MGSQLGRYEILQRLARGSVADVLLARASGLEGFARHVVIKQIHPEQATDTRFVKAFLDEARIGASLNHQNIVQVFDIDQVDGSPFFAMEYVHGEDVRRLLAKVVTARAQVPIEIVVAIGAAASAGLHHAHEALGQDRQPLNLVHRDVSPGNILIGFDGSVKLVDFGLAKPALSSQKTRAGALGKAPYMSPELCLGTTVDRRSDIFALGTVLYELATARRLFKGDNDYGTMQMIVEGAVPPPSTLRPDLPRQFDEIIMRALAKSPASRYQTAYDLRSALESFAIEHELRTTAKAIADYLASVFGSRQEPWHIQGEPEPSQEDDVDFEAQHGLIPTPSNGNRVIQNTASPIALAREIATGHTPDPDVGAFDENPTRIDMPPDDEETATLTGHGESTTTAAQPIVDVLTGVQPQVRAGDVLRTAQTLTVDSIEESFGQRTGLTNESKTLEDAQLPFGDDAPSTVKNPGQRRAPPVIDEAARTIEMPPSAFASLPGASTPTKPPAFDGARTIPSGPRSMAPGFAPDPDAGRTTPMPRSGSQPLPRLANASGFTQAQGSSPHDVQRGPHGAIVPVPSPHVPTRADTDAADEATTVEPPLFPGPELTIPGPPPESVYVAPTTEPLRVDSQLQRWGLVGAVLLIPLVIGLLAHACHGH